MIVFVVTDVSAFVQSDSAPAVVLLFLLYGLSMVTRC